MNKYLSILIIITVLFFLPKQVSAIEYTCCSITNYYESDSADLREKSQRNPTFENVYHYLTSIYRTKFGSTYLEKINKAITLFPDSGQFHYLKGMVYTDQPSYNKKLVSDYTISSEHFDDSLGVISFLKSAELNYMSGDSYYKVGSTLYHHNKFLKAKLYLNKAIKNGVCCYMHSPSVLLTIMELKTLQVDSAINTFRKARATYSTKFDDELYFYLSADSALQEKLRDGEWTFRQKEVLDDMYYNSLFDFRSIEQEIINKALKESKFYEDFKLCALNEDTIRLCNRISDINTNVEHCGKLILSDFDDELDSLTPNKSNKDYPNVMVIYQFEKKEDMYVIGFWRPYSGGNLKLFYQVVDGVFELKSHESGAF